MAIDIDIHRPVNVLVITCMLNFLCEFDFQMLEVEVHDSFTILLDGCFLLG